MRIVRDYEVSIWTLQDSFITVLKPFGIELKGQIQDPDFVLKDDGTQEFSFKLPMYYSLEGQRIENPLWCNTINGVIIASMRKAKVIFQKHTPRQKVFEFLITKVVESHEKDTLMCEISCEGLAFHELGKIGYKIALETEDITYDQDAWYDGTEMEDEETGEKYILGSDQRRYGLEMPQPTLQYWNDKVFRRSDGEWKWHWSYEIQMDYSNNPGLGRVSDKVYEDEYISSWAYNSDRNQVEAQAYENNREKYRTVDLTESNVYNLTQDLAKEFGVFCRYEYEHDDNFHITGRKVIYYNNFIIEKLGQLDITYPYNASKIARTSDSTDMITKMYVKVDSGDTEGEQVTIMNSSSNKTREDYILNFDYLNTVGAITPHQYEEVKKFETNVYNLNMQLIPLQNQMILLSDELPDLKANRTTLENSIAGDEEARSSANDLLNALTNNTGIIEVTAANPKMGIIMGDNPNYIKISELGVDYSTLHIYKTYNTSSHVLTDEYQGSPVYDEFGNLTQVQNLYHYQSYYYQPANGLATFNGEYGHLNSLVQTQDPEVGNIATYKFLFNSRVFKAGFKNYSGYLLSGFNLSFNIDFDTPPSKYSAKVYFLHYGKTISENQKPQVEASYIGASNQKRYSPQIYVPPNNTMPEFRFNSSDYNNGIVIQVVVTHDGVLASTAVDTPSLPTNGIKASLSLGGKLESTESHTSRVQSRVYLTYSYSPQLYYERVAEIWRNREIIDRKKLEEVNQKIEAIENKIDECEKKFNELTDEKELLLTRFEKLMGPALREGYWQPEEYHDYGDQYLEAFKTNNPEIAYIYYSDTDNVRYKVGYIDDTKDDTKVQLKFVYDSEPMAGEQTNYINSFTEDNEQEYYFYPCIKLTNSSIMSFVKEYYNELSVSFCDVTQLDTKYRTNEAYRKIYHINSRCEYAYMNINGVPTPVIMVTGARIDNLTDRQFAALVGQTYSDGNQIYDEFNNVDVRLTIIDPLSTTIKESYKIKKDDWFIPTESNQMIYPRLQISSLNLRTDNDEIDIKYNKNLLENYVDYSLLIRDNSYYATFKPIVFARYGWGLDGEIRFIVSNANTAVYLDALEVSKENSRPKVEYELTINSVNKKLIDEAYNYLGYIANINDFDLKFENTRGYVSELDLKLDKPSDDTITIKNYKTKFEDLFSTIVAQTEQMQKNATTIAVASSIFTTNGKLIPDVVEESIRHVNLDEAFSKGTLTWDEAEGMWAESDSGVVAIRGGGIFTATSQDANGKWKWNTGITPEGINADLITTGQLDTNRIKVYAGDQLRFQLNADGLFAYKTIFDNPKPEYTWAKNYSDISREIEENHGIDYRQYVVHNGEGLFLIAKKDAPLILENRGNDGYYISRITQDIERVAITWDGLTLRNYYNEKVFYADADTGDLTLAGTIYAKAGVFEGEVRAKSLFIGDDTTKDYINEDGHLLPTIFGDDLASGITKAASLTVDSDSGKILLSSLQFDSLGGDASALVMDPQRIEFFVEKISPTENDNGSSTNTTKESSVLINSEGIFLNAGKLHFTSSGTTESSTFEEKMNSVNNSLTTINGNISTINGNITKINNSISEFQITPSQIWANVTGWMNPDPDSPVIDQNAYTGSLHLASDSISLSTTTGSITSSFFINNDGLILDYRTSNDEAIITMDKDGINMTGNNIIINGQPIWSHENIVIVNSNLNTQASDYWRSTVERIEKYMNEGKVTIGSKTYTRPEGPSSGDWVLIVPTYNATISYSSSEQLGSSSRGGKLTPDNGNLTELGDGASWYKYTITLVANKRSGESNSVRNLKIYLSNSSMSSAPSSGSYILINADVSAWGKNFTFSVRSTGASKINLCHSNTDIYCYVSGGSGFNLASMTLLCETDSTVTKAPCTVYYYP